MSMNTERYLFLFFLGLIVTAQVVTWLNSNRFWERKRELKVYINHPSQQNGEVLLAIVNDFSVAETIGYKTKRLVVPNYQEYVEKMDEPEIYIFVSKEELEKKFVLREVPYKGT